MNNRLKKKLTNEVILKDFSDILDTEHRKELINLIICFFVPALNFIAFPIRLYRMLKSRNKYPKEDIVKIWEDTCIHKWDVSGQRHYTTHLRFEKTGRLVCDHRNSSSVHIASYPDTFDGQKFYLALVQHRRHRAILIYPQASWRTFDVSPEETEEEIQQELGLIGMIMDSGNHAFIASTVQERISDPRAWTVSLTKPHEQLTLAERLALNHFRGFMAPALEYICWYCSPSLQEIIVPHLAEQEKKLYHHFAEKTDCPHDNQL